VLTWVQGDDVSLVCSQSVLHPEAWTFVEGCVCCSRNPADSLATSLALLLVAVVQSVYY
jgi:hypothetical protein